jgi:hypothetical protein
LGEVISEFLCLLIVLVADTEFEFALLGAEHDRLAVHPPDHVEGRLGFAAQGEFEEVFLHPGFERLAQLRLDLEEPVGRAQALDALMRALVVVILDPELDALAGGLERVELGTDEEVLPDRGPEALDLAEGHRVMGTGLEVRHPILLELGLETAGAAPGGVLAAVVREHLLGRLILADGDAIHLDDRRRRGTAEQIRADDEARIIVQEGDEVGVTPAEAEGEDVRLPHLIGRGPLEEAGPGDIALLGRRGRRHQPGRMQLPAHGLGTGREQEPAAEPLADALDAEAGVLLLEREDLLPDGRWQLGRACVLGGGLEARLAKLMVTFNPIAEGGVAQLEFRADGALTEALLEVQADGFKPELRCIAAARFFGAIPPRGDGRMRLLLFDYGSFIHVNTPSIIGVSTPFPLKSVS